MLRKRKHERLQRVQQQYEAELKQADEEFEVLSIPVALPVHMFSACWVSAGPDDYGEACMNCWRCFSFSVQLLTLRWLSYFCFAAD